jgi:hypothetical protein
MCRFLKFHLLMIEHPDHPLIIKSIQQYSKIVVFVLLLFFKYGVSSSLIYIFAHPHINLHSYLHCLCKRFCVLWAFP